VKRSRGASKPTVAPGVVFTPAQRWRWAKAKENTHVFERKFGGGGRHSVWLERNYETLYSLLGRISAELRASTTKAQRLELAIALDRLATEILSLIPNPPSRGRREVFGTRQAVALAVGLMHREKISQTLAVDVVGNGDAKAMQRVERALRNWKAGKSSYLVLSYSETDYEIVKRRVPRVHRIK
jgi:hypothetical protein